MKASSKNILSKKLIEEIATARLNGLSTDGIVSKYQRLDFPLKYFAASGSIFLSLSSMLIS